MPFTPMFGMLVAVGVLIGLGSVGSVHAETHHDPLLESAMRLVAEPLRLDALFNDAPVFPVAASQPANTRPSRELLDMVAAWLGANFDLGEYSERPRVEFVPTAKLVALRYRGLGSGLIG